MKNPYDSWGYVYPGVTGLQPRPCEPQAGTLGGRLEGGFRPSEKAVGKTSLSTWGEMCRKFCDCDLCWDGEKVTSKVGDKMISH